MLPLMGHRFVGLLLVAGAAGALGACGKEIGDACNMGTDCSPNGDRQCDPSSVSGYCTIQGCDVSTCPSEAACVRFFTSGFSNKACDPAAAATCQPGSASCCSLDEQCAVTGFCVARAAEVRYCMRKCQSDGDCRDRYECRDVDKMKLHGGEPVLKSGEIVDDKSPKFCAAAPATP
jgi:hypothetical protein